MHSSPDAWHGLSKAVAGFATFYNAIYGTPSEGALAYPVQACLHSVFRSKIRYEEDHPYLKCAGDLGRPAQIDFVGVENGDRWSFALEVKVFNRQKRARAIRDIVKLLLLTKTDKYRYTGKYLLLVFPRNSSGIKFDDEGAPFSTVWCKGSRSKNLFEVLLPWKLLKQKIRLSLLPEQLQSEFRSALNSFSIHDIPDDLIVRRVGSSASDDFACGIWRFETVSMKRRFEGSLPRTT